MDDPTLQKVTIPIEDEDSFVSEVAWACHLGADRYRIDTILGFTSGVSNGDVVRVDVLPDGRLMAIEVLERYDGPTFVLSPDESLDRKQLWELLTGMVDDAPRRGVAIEGLMDGLVAVQYRSFAEPWFWDELVARLGRLTSTHVAVAHDDQRVGPVGYWLVTHPTWETPATLDASRVRANAHAPDLVAVDWPLEGDGVTAGWPEDLVEDLRTRASADVRLRELLDARLYLQVVTLELRFWAIEEHGPERAGSQQWPLGASVDVAEARAEWRDAHGPDGRVRYAPDDTVNEAIRQHIAALGLDPDDDPYLASVRAGD